MSSNNGIIRIGRKGIKKFAFGEEGTSGSEPFAVDVVVAFQKWMQIDDSFRPEEEDAQGLRKVPMSEMLAYQQAAVEFVEDLRGRGIVRDGVTVSGYEPVNAAEALDFLARLREEYDRLADFFHPRSRQKPDSPATSAEPSAELRFSVEPETGS